MQLIGQSSNLDIISTWKCLPQFIIIQGDNHTGKTHLILYLCEKFGLKYVLLDNSVKNVRELVSMMTEDSNTLYHFKDFDKASLQAKNALLKITEEPINGNYIAITGGRQIKTLESRAKKLIMSSYTFDEMCSVFKTYNEDKIMQKNLYNAGINTPSKVALYMKYESIYGLVNFAYEIFNKITFLSEVECISIVSKFDARYDDVDAAFLFLELLVHIIENNILNTQNYDYFDILNTLLSGKECLEKDRSLNRKFILYRVFYTIYNYRREQCNEEVGRFKKGATK